LSFHVSLKAKLDLGPDGVYSMLIDPEVKPWKNIKACTFRKVWEDDGAGRQLVEVEQVAAGTWLKTVKTRLMVSQDATERRMTFTLAQPGVMKVFNGEWNLSECPSDGKGKPPCTWACLEQEMVPGAGVPRPLRGIVRGCILKQVRKMMHDMQDEARRLAGVQSGVIPALSAEATHASCALHNAADLASRPRPRSLASQSLRAASAAASLAIVIGIGLPGPAASLAWRLVIGAAAGKLLSTGHNRSCRRRQHTFHTLGCSGVMAAKTACNLMSHPIDVCDDDLDESVAMHGADVWKLADLQRAAKAGYWQYNDVPLAKTLARALWGSRQVAGGSSDSVVHSTRSALKAPTLTSKSTLLLQGYLAGAALFELLAGVFGMACVVVTVWRALSSLVVAPACGLLGGAGWNVGDVCMYLAQPSPMLSML
jgi:hypothetical protein